MIVEALIRGRHDGAFVKARFIIFGTIVVLHIAFLALSIWRLIVSGIEYLWAAPAITHTAISILVMTTRYNTTRARQQARTQSDHAHAESLSPHLPPPHEGLPWLGVVSAVTLIVSVVLLATSVLDGWDRKQFAGQCGLSMLVLATAAIPLQNMIEKRRRRRMQRRAQRSVAASFGYELSTQDLVPDIWSLLF